MKKIFYLCLLCNIFCFFGCNKTPKGEYIIENQSSYTINVGTGQNYQLKDYEIRSGESISIDWTVYFSHYLNSPSFTLIREKKEANKSIYVDKSPSNKYRIINKLPNSIMVNEKPIKIILRLHDNGKMILSENGIYTQFVDISNTEPYTDITAFKEINQEDIFITCIDEDKKKDAKFNFKYANESETKTYRVIEKTGNDFYFQEISADKKTLLTSKIDIRRVDIKSEYKDSNGKSKTEIIHAIIISKN